MNTINHLRLKLYENDDFWKKEFGIKVKLVMGEQVKILDKYYPKISFYELDKEYYITSNKYNHDKVIEFGLDEKYENFNGFEKFLDHFCRHDPDYFEDLYIYGSQDDLCCHIPIVESTFYILFRRLL